MGDDAPTEFRGVAQAETEAAFAWADEDGVDDEVVWQRSWKPVLAAVGASLFVVGIAAGLVSKHLEESSVAGPVTTTVVATPTVSVPPATFKAEVPDANTVEPPPPPSPKFIPGTGITAEELAAWDHQFLTRMMAQGWTVDDPALMTHRAHETCAQLEHGDPPVLVQRRMTVNGVSPVGAYQFVTTAMGTYPDCP